MALDPGTLKSLTDNVARFVRERLIPAEADVASSDRIPEDIVSDMRSLGLFGMTLPEQYGGLDLTAAEEMQLVFELCYAAPVFRGYIGANNGIVGRALLLGGTDAQKERYLSGIASGRLLTAFALTEPGSGSDAAALKTRADRSSDGRWKLNGSKRYVTGASEADLVIVAARTDPASTNAKGVSLFAAPKGSPGMVPGKTERKMGQNGIHTGDLYFDNCILEEDALLGQEGRGFQLTMQVIDRGRLHMGAVCVGLSQRLLDESLAYALQRKQFGSAIAEFQLIQAMLADSQADLLAARALVLDVAARSDKGENISMEASCCKMLASEMLGRVADRAVQIHGGAGYMQDCAVERLYRDARIFRIYEGTTQIQQLTIAKHMIRRATAA